MPCVVLPNPNVGLVNYKDGESKGVHREESVDVHTSEVEVFVTVPKFVTVSAFTPRYHAEEASFQ